MAPQNSVFMGFISGLMLSQDPLQSFYGYTKPELLVQVEATWSAEVVMEVLRHLDEKPDLAHTAAPRTTAGQEMFESVAA